jgi:hypothetical protein
MLLLNVNVWKFPVLIFSMVNIVYITHINKNSLWSLRIPKNIKTLWDQNIWEIKYKMLSAPHPLFFLVQWFFTMFRAGASVMDKPVLSFRSIPSQWPWDLKVEWKVSNCFWMLTVATLTISAADPWTVVLMAWRSAYERQQVLHQISQQGFTLALGVHTLPFILAVRMDIWTEMWHRTSTLRLHPKNNDHNDPQLYILSYPCKDRWSRRSDCFSLEIFNTQLEPQNCIALRIYSVIQNYVTL